MPTVMPPPTNPTEEFLAAPTPRKPLPTPPMRHSASTTVQSNHSTSPTPTSPLSNQSNTQPNPTAKLSTSIPAPTKTGLVAKQISMVQKATAPPTLQPHGSTLNPKMGKLSHSPSAPETRIKIGYIFNNN